MDVYARGIAEFDPAGQQFARVVAAIEEKFPAAAEHLDDARADLLAFTDFPREIWRQIWSNNPQVILSFWFDRWSDLGGCVEDIVLDTAVVFAGRSFSRVRSLPAWRCFDAGSQVLLVG